MSPSQPTATAGNRRHSDSVRHRSSIIKDTLYYHIRTYLAGVRHLHIIHGLGNPLEGNLRLNLVLEGINSVKPCPNCPHLPVTPLIMNALKSALETQPCFKSTMLWAACCVGFFSFLRCGEFTIPSANAYNKERHLSIIDVAVDCHTKSSTIAIRIKFSKTNQFGWVQRFTLAAPPITLASECSTSVSHGETIRRGPTFCYISRYTIDEPNFVSRVKEMLGHVGLDTSHNKGHSFCIGWQLQQLHADCPKDSSSLLVGGPAQLISPTFESHPLTWQAYRLF